MRTERTQDVPPLPVRWWPLVLIFLCGGSLLSAIQFWGWSVIRPSQDFLIVIGFMNLAVYLWVRVWSRLRRTSQIVTIGIVLIFQVGLVTLFRLDEFAGDGRILVKWRWGPTPEQRLADFSSKPKDRTLPANLVSESETDSPAFRGRDRSGQYHLPQLDLNWNEHPPRELWRHPVGRGWSSFVVVGDFCVTQEQRDQFESVVCYELNTGKEVWEHRDKARFEEVTSGAGPRATPTIYQGRVYSFGATGILNCLEGTDGSVVWSQKIENKSPPLFGYASSPLIYGGLLFITPSGDAGSVLAVNLETGKTVWSQGERKAGYSSPHLCRMGKEDQILVFDATGLHANDSLTGETRWNFLWGDNSDEQVNVCQPVVLPAGVRNDLEEADALKILISSGYGRGSAVLSVSENSAGEWTVQEVWKSKRLKSKFSDVVIREGYAYGLDEGILTCISLMDGTSRWKSGRYGYGQLILVNETLLIQAESGRIVLVPADPNKFVEVASLDGLKERTWNQPVVAGRYLVIRNDREAVCYELPCLPEDDR